MNKESCRVLMVAGHYQATEQIVRYLERHGLEVIWTESPQDALAMLEAHSFNVILSSLHLRQGSGLDVLAYVAEHELLVPVLMMAQSAVLQDVLNALRSGACDFFIQPQYDLHALLKSVRKHVHKYAAVMENEAYREALEKNNHQLQLSLGELEADQKAGRQIQQKMLPSSPVEINGYRFDHQLIPSLYLSGDFIDYFSLNNDLTVFYLADISGHGASSAFVTVLLKNLTNRLIRNYRRQSSFDILSPVSMLRRINQELLDTQLGKHLTIVVGLIEHRAQRLHYAIGGHFPKPVLTDEQGTRFLPGEGMPVGLFPFPHYEEHSMSIGSHWALTVFTDGVLEVMPGSLAEKEARLLQLVESSLHQPELIIEQLNLKVMELPDDVALLSVNKL
ncbi:SpoIIE family protein phosphatase [Balneatrix alpica]